MAAVPVVHEWTPDAIVGFAYSTSVLSRAVLGDLGPEFKADLTRQLRAHDPADPCDKPSTSPTTWPSAPPSWAAQRRPLPGSPRWSLPGNAGAGLLTKLVIKPCR